MSLSMSVETDSLPELARLEELRQRLAGNQDRTRADVAAVVRARGFWAYIGGRHVAVHRRTRGGRATENRLAIITGTGPDWS